MSYGITTELTELIGLQRLVQKGPADVSGRAKQQGGHVSPWRGRGMDFSEVRSYQAGDDIRHMEWRVTARTGKPHVKLYQEERERPVILLIDFNPSMYFGTRVAFKSVIAARLAAILAWTVVSRGDCVGGLLFSADTHREFMPRGRKAGVLPFLAALSLYTQARPAPNADLRRRLSDPLQRVRRVVRPGSLLIVISDCYSMDKESESLLSRLRLHNDVLVYHLCDPLELSPPAPGCYPITDGIKDRVLDTSEPAENAGYRRYCDQRILEVQAPLKRLQIPYVQVTALHDLSLLVRQTFLRRSHG
ncbi:MAG: DUF58 domain-containing protein [Legionellales bacterium]|nr:DUF58 domain-containing protein [Legionellales bacterium]